MPTTPPGPAAGGFPLALGLIGGAIVGLALHQPTIGVLTGLAIGAAVAVLVWLRSR